MSTLKHPPRNGNLSKSNPTQGVGDLSKQAKNGSEGQIYTITFNMAFVATGPTNRAENAATKWLKEFNRRKWEGGAYQLGDAKYCYFHFRLKDGQAVPEVPKESDDEITGISITKVDPKKDDVAKIHDWPVTLWEPEKDEKLQRKMIEPDRKFIDLFNQLPEYGFGLVAGDTGIFKSMGTLNLLLSTKLNGGYYSQENTKEWSARQSYDKEGSLIWLPCEKKSLNETLAIIETYTEKYNLKWVYLDPIDRIWGDPNSDQVGDRLVDVQNLAERLKILILFTRGEGKNESYTGLKKVRGSSNFYQVPRYCFTVEKIEEGTPESKESNGEKCSLFRRTKANLLPKPDQYVKFILDKQLKKFEHLSEQVNLVRCEFKGLKADRPPEAYTKAIKIDVDKAETDKHIVLSEIKGAGEKAWCEGLLTKLIKERGFTRNRFFRVIKGLKAKNWIDTENPVGKPGWYEIKDEKAVTEFLDSL